MPCRASGCCGRPWTQGDCPTMTTPCQGIVTNAAPGRGGRGAHRLAAEGKVAPRDPVPPPLARRRALGKRLAGLEERLQVREDEHPAHAGDVRRRLRRALEAVVDDREERRAAVLRLELPRDAARLLRGEDGVVAGDPLV